MTEKRVGFSRYLIGVHTKGVGVEDPKEYIKNSKRVLNELDRITEVRYISGVIEEASDLLDNSRRRDGLVIELGLVEGDLGSVGLAAAFDDFTVNIIQSLEKKEGKE